jgi:hypothetical protein
VGGTFSFVWDLNFSSSNKMNYRAWRGAEMKKWLAVAYFLLVALIEGASAQQTLKELRISAIPDENPQEMLRIYSSKISYYLSYFYLCLGNYRRLS